MYSFNTGDVEGSSSPSTDTTVHDPAAWVPRTRSIADSPLRSVGDPE
jgi:hypothetical protein